MYVYSSYPGVSKGRQRCTCGAGAAVVVALHRIGKCAIFLTVNNPSLWSRVHKLLIHISMMDFFVSYGLCILHNGPQCPRVQWMDHRSSVMLVIQFIHSESSDHGGMVGRSYRSSKIFFVPAVLLSIFYFFLSLLSVSFLLFPCASVWKNSSARVPHFLNIAILNSTSFFRSVTE